MKPPDGPQGVCEDPVQRLQQEPAFRGERGGRARQRSAIKNKICQAASGDEALDGRFFFFFFLGQRCRSQSDTFLSGPQHGAARGAVEESSSVKHESLKCFSCLDLVLFCSTETTLFFKDENSIMMKWRFSRQRKQKATFTVSAALILILSS